MEKIEMSLETQRLIALNELASRISFSSDEREMLTQILDFSSRILRVEGISLLLLDPEKESLSFYVARGPKATEIEKLNISIQVGQGIAGTVCQNGKPLIVNNPTSHPKFLQSVDKKTGFKTDNLLCVPLVIKMKPWGVVEAVNKKDGNFTLSDQNFLQTIAGFLSIVLQNYKLFLQVQETKNFFRALLDNMPGGFIAVNREQEVVEFNGMAGRILGIAPSGIRNRPLRDFPPLYAPLAKILSETLTKELIQNRLILECQKSNGEKIILGYGTIVIKDDTGTVIGAGLIFQDLNKIKGLP